MGVAAEVDLRVVYQVETVAAWVEGTGAVVVGQPGLAVSARRTVGAAQPRTTLGTTSCRWPR